MCLDPGDLHDAALIRCPGQASAGMKISVSDPGPLPAATRQIAFGVLRATYYYGYSCIQYGYISYEFLGLGGSILKWVTS